MLPATIIREACISATGYAPDEHLILSKLGRWLRFSTTGKPADKSGGLKVHDVGDCYVYLITNHRDGLSVKGTTRTSNTQIMTPEEKHKAQQQRRMLEQQQREQSARKRRMLSAMVKRIWKTAKKPQEWGNPHPYLTKKGDLPALNIRRYTSHKRDVLLLPMVDLTTGKLESLYLIYPNKFKRPLKGTQSKGLCMAIGRDLDKSAVLWLAEGYATGLSLHLEVNQPVIVCFSAGNLQPVTDKLVQRYPAAELKLCADDDRATLAKTGKNPGIEYAVKLQRRYPTIALYKPLFPPGSPEGLSDINDLINWQRNQGRVEA
ncbi:MAG: hypothetical protein BWK73_37770 [Thiothrix lacustris]|uniref:Toprim domain-containing protein n=1 Tax=Thiothrix lacustris TaxID=525917 RepID=A0A1Y1QEZ6_9GAMM|nr:MAG: hypothetical protein BWK73_37770 [Thiothrix lacustris]